MAIPSSGHDSLKVLLIEQDWTKDMARNKRYAMFFLKKQRPSLSMSPLPVIKPYTWQMGHSSESCCSSSLCLVLCSGFILSEDSSIKSSKLEGMTDFTFARFLLGRHRFVRDSPDKDEVLGEWCKASFTADKKGILLFLRLSRFQVAGNGECWTMVCFHKPVCNGFNRVIPCNLII